MHTLVVINSLLLGLETVSTKEKSCLALEIDNYRDSEVMDIEREPTVTTLLSHQFTSK